MVVRGCRRKGPNPAQPFTPQVRGVTAVVARVARAVIEAVLLTAAVTSVLWVVMSPQGPWTVARLAVMAVTVAGAAWCWAALVPEGENHG